MSKNKLLISLIEALEKKEYDKTAKLYLKEVYGCQRIVNTDGTDDTGIDMKVFDLNNEKIQYQLTTQKSSTAQEKSQFNKKIREDFIKAKENNEKYGYSNTLIFFSSHTHTNKVIRSFEREALTKHGLNLDFIDANRLAEESEDFPEIQRALYKLNEFEGLDHLETLFEDESKNLIYDLIGFGKSSEIRKQIVEAHILQSLFEKKKLDKNSIIDSCVEKFSAKDNKIFYEKLFAQLSTQRRIIKSEDGHNYMLQSEEESRINTLYQKHDLEEDLFLKGVHDILDKYNLENQIEDFVIHLKQIYTDNFNSDLNELLTEDESTDLLGVSREFKFFLEEKTKEPSIAKPLAIDLLTFCQDNKFIQKYCAGKVFGDTTNYDALERYVNTKKRIFLDTQIILYALCYFYKPNCENSNYFFQITSSLIKYSKVNAIDLYVIDNYLWEARNHIQEAISLIPFTNLPSFQKLGTSRNVFYNFFLYLEKECLNEDKSFSDFLNDFGFTSYSDWKSIDSKIETYFNELGIKNIQVEKRYDLSLSQRLIQEELIASGKFKTKFSLNNDALMAEFLADNDTDIHPLQPIFTSWDRIFYKIRGKYFKKYPNSQRWFLFTPSKLIDHHAMLDFSIDSETVTRELLALVSDEIIINTHSLLDSITHILNPNEEVGLEYTNKLAEIRDNEIHQIKQNQIIPPDEIEGEAVIDDVFYKLTAHYQQKDTIEDFKKVFTRKDFIDKVIDILMREVNNFYNSKHVSEGLYNDFDDLINEINKGTEQRITRHKTQ